MENLSRGLVAVNTSGSNVFVSWRVLGTDASTTTFNLYRNGTKVNASPLNVSNYTDTAGSASAVYSVRPVVGGTEQAAVTQITSVWSNLYWTLNLQQPAGGVSPDSVTYTYSPNDCSAGDVDGDGEYEIFVKWDPSNSKDNSQSGYTGNVYLDCYKLNSTRLWRIDLGQNIRAGAHYTQFQVYDFDSDGKAELMCKTAPGTKDGTGAYLSLGNAATVVHSDDYRNSSGYVLSGPELLTVFNGSTGKEMATTLYLPARGTVSSWGDSYGNRVDRFLACTAYLDGSKPSAVFCRGYYTRAVLVAWDWRNGTLSKRWTFDSNTSGNGAYAGQGAHCLATGDVDGDGKDEIVYGSCSIDHDGSGLYSTGLGHGDALHLSDMNPDRAGQEIWMAHEEWDTNGGVGADFRDALTGSALWSVPATVDVGRGLALNIDANYRGFECWSSVNNVRSCTGNAYSSTKPSINFGVFWDGDLESEILNDEMIDDWTGSGTNRLLTAYNYGAESNNTTKANPGLSADLFGDWREEVVWRNSNNTQLMIFTTTLSTNHRLYTLMHDRQYREAIAWQNTAYNQPPHTSFYIGSDMSTAPTPDISVPATATPSSPTATPTRTLTPTWTATPTNTMTSTSTPVGFRVAQLETPCAMDGVLEASNAGWTGTGYANLTNAAGSTLVFSLAATGPEVVSLSFRYANGGTASRDMSLVVNGVTQAATLAFPATGAWTTWGTAVVPVTLSGGDNTLLLTALTSDGGPNLDAATWISTTVSAGNCSGGTFTPTLSRTMSPTATWSRTSTPTQSRTPTRTASMTPTASFTLTPTRTPTPSATSTSTRTSTPSPSPTRSLTPTYSPTWTQTSTATRTPTGTVTPTWSRTSTMTMTSTGTPTRTATVSRTPTATFSATATSTATSTVTNSATPSLTLTRTSTASTTATSSPTHTASPTATQPVTSTPTGTASPSATPTRTRTASFTSTPTSTSTVVFTLTRTWTPTSTGTPTPTLTNTSVPTASWTPTSSWTRTWTPTPTFTATPTSSSTRTPSSTSTPSPTGTALLTATWTTTSSQTHSATPSDTPPMTSTPTSTFTRTLSPTATPSDTATGTFTPTSTLTQPSSPTATATGTETLVFTPTETPPPTLSPTATSSSTTTGTFTPTSTLTQTSSPTATATGTETHVFTPTETTPPTLSPTATSSSTTTGTFTPTSTLTQTSSSTATATGTETHVFTPTLTTTPTDTRTASSTPTKTETPPFTSTPSPTASGTATSTHSPSPTVTWTGTMTLTNTWTKTHTPTATDTPTVTSTVTETRTGTPSNTFTHSPTAVFTETRTSSPTFTPTSTPTLLEAEDREGIRISNPYPNPAWDGISRVDLVFPCEKRVVWSVFTTAYRKVAEGELMATGRTTLAWDHRDARGKPVAGGLYYWVFRVEGCPTSIRTLVVLR